MAGKSVYMVLLAITSTFAIGALGLMANTFQNHPMFAPIVYVAIAVLGGALFVLLRRAKTTPFQRRGD